MNRHRMPRIRILAVLTVFLAVTGAAQAAEYSARWGDFIQSLPASTPYSAVGTEPPQIISCGWWNSCIAKPPGSPWAYNYFYGEAHRGEMKLFQASEYTTINTQLSVYMVFDDVVFSCPGETGNITTTLNLSFKGQITRCGDGFWTTGGVGLEEVRTGDAYHVSDDRWIYFCNDTMDQGGIFSVLPPHTGGLPSIDATLVGDPFTRTLDVPSTIYIHARLDQSVYVIGDFRTGDNGISFPTDGPVFNLPEGCTANSVEANIVDNEWLGAENLDQDGDAIPDLDDNCPEVSNPEQDDADSDGVGDACDDDDDGDGVNDGDDNCPVDPNPDQADADADGEGDLCDGDPDGDGIGEGDNCPLVSNEYQTDGDLDGVGDACDADDDNDGVCDLDADDVDCTAGPDNCQTLPNPDQSDHDVDGIGDACDADDDNDGICDGMDATPSCAAGPDNCPGDANPSQDDYDYDGAGDVCDEDDDNDGFADDEDNCPLLPNDQTDVDGDGLGDECDPDDDDDGVADEADNCPLVANTTQGDADGDGAGDACDADDDDDGVADEADNCPFLANGDQADLDGDGAGDACDGDLDGDGVANDGDNCPADANGDQADLDGDGAGDACDGDLDGDGTDNDSDNCVSTPNPSQIDTDTDGMGDACDLDDDGDGVDDVNDNCAFAANPDQTDLDGDGLGDACDGDIDGDGVDNHHDVCGNTLPGQVVNPANGCSIDQLCPCDGPRGQTVSWKNHGKYISCIARASNDFVDAELISEADRSAKVSQAAQSDCGK